MAGEPRSQPGVSKGSATGPMMGDTPSGVVARRTLSVVRRPPSGELTRAPTGTRACAERYDEHCYIRPGRGPVAPKWVLDGVGGRRGGAAAVGVVGFSAVSAYQGPRPCRGAEADSHYRGPLGCGGSAVAVQKQGLRHRFRGAQAVLHNPGGAETLRFRSCSSSTRCRRPCCAAEGDLHGFSSENPRDSPLQSIDKVPSSLLCRRDKSIWSSFLTVTRRFTTMGTAKMFFCRLWRHFSHSVQLDVDCPPCRDFFEPRWPTVLCHRGLPCLLRFSLTRYR